MRSLNVEEVEPLEDLAVDGRIILNLTLKTASEGAYWIHRTQDRARDRPLRKR